MMMSRIARLQNNLTRSVMGLLVLSLFFHFPTRTSQPLLSTPNYLHTSGSQILDASNKVAGLSGINWFGFETSNNSPHGLWVRNWEDMLDQIKAQGYNVIRLPFSNAMLKEDVMPSGIDYQKNPDLAELTALQVMDKIIRGANERGIKIILDNHRSTPGGGPESNGLWYTSEYSENDWILDWKKLVWRYKYIPAVIAVDLCNEPYNACWGCGDSARDWRLAAEKAGNAVLSVNPDLLVIVEGVAVHNGQNTWWGGNLIGAKEFPIRLNVPNRLVYSAHEYPETIYPQPWFSDSNYPNNLPAVWDKYWGYLVKENIAPVLIGEFGTRYETEKDRQWLSQFQKYVRQNKISWTYWSLNPNSGDTGGLLQDDWVTIHQTKQNILRQMQYPFITHFAGLQEK
jgi:endoglucanase